MEQVTPLSSLVEDPSLGRAHSSDITLFCPVGLAGTEVYLLADIANELGSN